MVGMVQCERNSYPHQFSTGLKIRALPCERNHSILPWKLQDRSTQNLSQTYHPLCFEVIALFIIYLTTDYNISTVKGQSLSGVLICCV